MESSQAQSVEALLLIHDGELATAVSGLVRDRFANHAVTVQVEVVSGDVAERARLERERRGAVPLGCTVPDEEMALSALEAGVDEALVLHTADARAIHTLIDRTLLRASLRRQGERISASVGHAEKLAALGTLVAGVAHEINNPLTIVMLSSGALVHAARHVDLAYEELDSFARQTSTVPPEVQEALEALRIARRGRGMHPCVDDICAATDTISEVVRDLRVFARIDEESPREQVDVAALVDQVLRIVRHEIERTAILERDIPADLPSLYVPRTRLVQVLTNVLINAAHAVREIERPVHRVRISARADDEAIAIVVADTGPGIAPADVDRIFDPFFTTKRQNLGTGLGLSISRSILRRLGGDMLVESVHGDGASFLLLVPVSDPAESATLQEAAGTSRALRASRRPVVLVVGASEAMVRAYTRGLDARYDVVIAGDEEEAIGFLESGTEADAVLVERSAGGLEWQRLRAWLARERPLLASRVVLVVSYPSEPAHDDTAFRPRILMKPVSRAQLLEAVDALLDSSDGDSEGDAGLRST